MIMTYVSFIIHPDIRSILVKVEGVGVGVGVGVNTSVKVGKDSEALLRRIPIHFVLFCFVFAGFHVCTFRS